MQPKKNPSEISLDGASVKLAARRWTLGEQPVLALHGWLDNAGSFDRLAPYLDGLDIVALDLPGHGLSGHHPPGYPYHFVDCVAEVFSAADSLGWEQFSLLGHSMGAGVATLAAGTFPARIKSLVLVEGLGPYTKPDEESATQLAKALLHRRSQGRRYYSSRSEAIERLTSRGLLSESAECLATRALEQSEQGWFFTYAAGLRTPSRARLSETQVRAFLRAITCSTLLITASDGLKALPAMVGRESEVADIRCSNLESGGHHLHLDYPERIWPEVVEHLLA